MSLEEISTADALLIFLGALGLLFSSVALNELVRRSRRQERRTGGRS